MGSKPVRKTNVAGQNPEKVQELQKRVDDLAGEMAKSLLLKSRYSKALLKAFTGKPPALPNEDEFYEQGD